MEYFKIIENTDNKYKISNLGRVLNIKKNKYLKPFKNEDGYYCVDINNKTLSIHRLVGIAFIPNLENKPMINHIDGDKSNNCVSNLEWCTNSENQLHAYNNNLQKRNELHASAKLTKEKVVYLRTNPDNLKVKELISKFEINKATYYKAINRITWKNI